MVYFCLHLVDFYGINVGKYTGPMDPMGYGKPLAENMDHPWRFFAAQVAPCFQVSATWIFQADLVGVGGEKWDVSVVSF